MYERAVERDCAIVRAWMRAYALPNERHAPIPAYRRDTLVSDGRIWGREGDARGYALYSYGSHFTVAEVWHPRGRRPLIILNGDRWGGSGGWHPSRTPEHQSAARAAAEGMGDRVDVCIIPFGAIEAARIDRGSIHVLEQREDAWVNESRALDLPLDNLSTAAATESATEDARVTYQWEDARSGRIITRITHNGEPVNAFSQDRRGFTHRNVIRTDAGEWVETWQEHRLGDLLFTARTDGIARRRRFVSSFDYSERAPLYFLAELPSRSRAMSVAAAVDDLAPRAVHAAYARGIPVYRQGDIFAVETALTDEQVYGRARARARLAPFRGNGRIRPEELGYMAPARRRRLIAARYRELRASSGFSIARAGKPSRTASARNQGVRPVPDYVARGAETERAKRAAAAVETRRRNRSSGRTAQNGAQASMSAAIMACVPFEIRFAVTRANGYAGYSAHGFPLSGVPEEYRPAVFQEYRRRRAITPASLKTARRYPPFERYSNLQRAAEWPLQELARVQRERRERRAALRAIEAAPDALTCYRRAVQDIALIDRRRIAEALSFYGTSHTATEVVKTKGGAIYARGTVRHATELETVLDGSGWARTPDHRPVTLGDRRTWHLIVRNTVPRARA